jgi:hypothetical protein
VDVIIDGSKENSGLYLFVIIGFTINCFIATTLHFSLSWMWAQYAAKHVQLDSGQLAVAVMEINSGSKRAIKIN